MELWISKFGSIFILYIWFILTCRANIIWVISLTIIIILLNTNQMIYFKPIGNNKMIWRRILNCLMLSVTYSSRSCSFIHLIIVLLRIVLIRSIIDWFISPVSCIILIILRNFFWLIIVILLFTTWVLDIWL